MERILVTSGRFQGGLRASSSPPDIDFTLSGTPRFRDPNMWYHCVLLGIQHKEQLQIELKLYVNGEIYFI